MRPLICILFASFPAACCSDLVDRWSRDEVDVVGLTDLHEGDATVLLDVKNLRDVEDGRYSFTIPIHPTEPAAPVIEWKGPRSEADPLWQVLTWDDSIRTGYRSDDAATRRIEKASAGRDEVRANADGDVASEPVFFELGAPPHRVRGDESMAARIVRDADRRFVVECFASSDAVRSWRCIGSVVVGTGEQSTLRAGIAPFIMPVAVFVDLALVPLYLVRNKICHGGFVSPDLAGP